MTTERLTGLRLDLARAVVGASLRRRTEVVIERESEKRKTVESSTSSTVTEGAGDTAPA